jgi:hypothetical protein
MLLFNDRRGYAFFTAIALLSIGFSACKKDQVSAEMKAKLDQVAVMARAANSLVGAAVTAGNGNQEKGAGFADDRMGERCGSFTATPAAPLVFPKSLVFDYGAGCTDVLGIERAGKFTIALQKLWEPGATSSITYANYKENSVLTDGTFSFTNTSTPLGFGFTLSATNLKRVETTGAQSTLQSSLSFRQTQGAVTFLNWNDDVYQITGTTQYTLPDNSSGSLTITAPLSKANNCAWISQGTGTVVLNGETFSIDYGNGTCDNQATVTIDGESFTITL